MLTIRRLLPLSLVSCLALATPLTALPSASFAQAVGVSITVAPPPLPVYAQPVIPAPGYLWVPGYWAWAGGGYYWVPGTWVLPPTVGLLWTPGYWAWLNGAYLWHAGYWGSHVGFYGGIDYGYGYTGTGYAGGRWDHGKFFYNRAVNNVGNNHLANVYNDPVHSTNATRASFNSGHGGTNARPTAAQQTASREHHVGPTALQTRHEQGAAGNQALRASVNHGRPAIAATARPANFTGRGVVAARGATPATATNARPAAAPGGARSPNQQQAQTPARPAAGSPIWSHPAAAAQTAAPSRPQPAQAAHAVPPVRAAAPPPPRAAQAAPAAPPVRAAAPPRPQPAQAAHAAPAVRAAAPPRPQPARAAHAAPPARAAAVRRAPPAQASHSARPAAASRAQPAARHVAQQGHGNEHERR